MLPAGSGRKGGGEIDELFRLVLSAAGYRDAMFAWPKFLVSRFDELVRAATTRDPQWTAQFLCWLRTGTPMRYPALVGAAAFVSERLVHEQHGMSRQVISSVLRRADDPGHLLAHWTAAYGRQVPKPVKRGVADAVVRLYHRDALRYDTNAHHLALPTNINREISNRKLVAPRPFRFADVIALVHPVARDDEQGDLFRQVINRRARVASVRLEMPRQGADVGVWDRVVAAMSVRDLLSNLRRFDASAIPFETAMTVAARLRDPAEVSASGMLPLRFVSANRSLRTRRWLPAMAEAAGHNVPTLPEIPGRTLIVIEPGLDESVVFGLTLAQRCAEADVVADNHKRFPVIHGESPLDGLTRWRMSDMEGLRPCWCGPAVHMFDRHQRVVFVAKDLDDITKLDVLDPVPVYGWQAEHHTCRYCAKDKHDTGPNRMMSYGLSDAAYPVIPLVEAARAGHWPWSGHTGGHGDTAVVD